jgi:phosphate transport system substrate-binding protein
MAQKNETPALILSLLLTIGLIGAGAWWFTRPGSGVGDLLGSGTPGSSPSSSGSSSAPPPAPVADDFAGVPNVPSGLFSYGGSTTWAPIRGQIDPVIQSVWSGYQLRYTNPPSGETPGSASGIRMLLDNQLTFAQSSRSLNPQEYQEAEQRGFTLREIPVALEGMAIAVNPNLNLPGLTLDQLRDIYTGQMAAPSNFLSQTFWAGKILAATSALSTPPLKLYEKFQPIPVEFIMPQLQKL